MGELEKNESRPTSTASSSLVSLIKRQPSIKRISRSLQLKNVDKTLQCSGKYSKHLVGKAMAEQSFDPLLYAENLTLLDRKNISSAYAEYVNSFITTNDKRYLKNGKLFRQVVPLRDIAGASIMSEDQFQKAKTLKTRPLRSDFLFSELKCSDDPLIQALAVCEKCNAMKSILTIIFICTRNSKGLNISGYIDYEPSLRHFKSGDSLDKRNWFHIFAGSQRIEPCKQDLSFMNWKSGDIHYTDDTNNFKNLPWCKIGLCFEHKAENCIIKIEKRILRGDRRCLEIELSKHGSAVLYDHRVRRQNGQ